MKYTLVGIVAFLFTSFMPLHAQVQSNALPSWVAMIDNPDANYYEAIKAFDDYWKDKIKPEGDDEASPLEKKEAHKDKNEKARERAQEELKKSLKKMSPQQRAEYDLIQYHYKRFETWIHESAPFVQADGRILSQQERINIWNQQQAEIKQQNK